MKSPGTRFRSPVFISVAVGLAWLLAACGATSQPAATPTPSPTPKPVVEAKEVGTVGKILVAGSNGMTLYIFARDVANSGKSACNTAPCPTRWPALTVAAGQKPTGTGGVSNADLGTIVRDDNQMTQVTYKGLPLYFYAMDTAPGDTKGTAIQGWSIVKP